MVVGIEERSSLISKRVWSWMRHRAVAQQHERPRRIEHQTLGAELLDEGRRDRSTAFCTSICRSLLAPGSELKYVPALRIAKSLFSI